MAVKSYKFCTYKSHMWNSDILLSKSNYLLQSNRNNILSFYNVQKFCYTKSIELYLILDK